MIPTGEYVRRWVSELAKLPARWIHKPWLAPPSALQEASVELGRSYPRPLVDHDEARKRALEVLRKSRGDATTRLEPDVKLLAFENALEETFHRRRRLCHHPANGDDLSLSHSDS